MNDMKAHSRARPLVSGRDGRTSICKDGVGVAVVVALGKGLHDTTDLLTLAWQHKGRAHKATLQRRDIIDRTRKHHRRNVMC